MRLGGFPEVSKRALADPQLRRKREPVVAEVADCEQLRNSGAAIKAAALADLIRQLERLEVAVSRRGGVVHRARDAAEANAIVAIIAAPGPIGAILTPQLHGMKQARTLPWHRHCAAPATRSAP